MEIRARGGENRRLLVALRCNLGVLFDFPQGILVIISLDDDVDDGVEWTVNDETRTMYPYFKNLMNSVWLKI